MYYVCLYIKWFYVLSLVAMTDAPRRTAKKLDFHGHDDRGIKPIGIGRLLDSADMNNENSWARNREYFAHGVLVPRVALSTEHIEKMLDGLSQYYPSDAKSHRAMGVAVHERWVQAQSKYNIRGDHITGDDDDIAKIWARAFLRQVPALQWDLFEEAMCWIGMLPGTVCVPYLDFDEYDLEDGFSRVWAHRITPTLKIINDTLAKMGAPVGRVAVFVNIRPIDDVSLPGLYKFSFHVHWPEFSVVSQASWKRFLMTLDDVPRKLRWDHCDGKLASSDASPSAPLFDLGVYGGKRQLFRGPYCGKKGQHGTTMRRCVVVSDGSTGYKLEHPLETEETLVRAILDARISVCRGALPLVDVEGPSSTLASRVSHADAGMTIRTAADGASRVVDQSAERVVKFCMPLFERCVLPEWQKFRHELMSSIGRAHGAVVPISNLTIVYHKAATRKGRVFFSVQGDTFCEMDPEHCHNKRGNECKIGFTVDFLRCTIMQTCLVCNEGTRFPGYAFLHVGNVVRIEPFERCGHSRITCWTKTSTPYHTLLHYFRERFVSQRSIRMIWVYDEDCRVWKSGRDGNMVAGRLIDELNRQHDMYISAQRRCFVDSRLRKFTAEDGDVSSDDDEHDDEDEDEKKAPKTLKAAIKKYEAAARKFIVNNTPFISMTPAARQKLIVDLAGYPINTEIAQMNPFGHYIPMRNLQYINVLTGEIGDMEREHYFTSVVNAIYNPEDPNIQAIEGWFEEISTGDQEKALYLKRLGAYCLTFLTHDRRYYILVGNGKNAKGMFKEFLILISTGPSGYEPRFKSLSQNFWSKSANANAGPEAPSPEAFDMREKTLLYTDDIAAIPLDTNRIKRVSANEKQSARDLYGGPTEIIPRGKVMHTSNFDPPGPGEDQAYWERVVVVHMLTKYVQTQSEVCAAKYRFIQDQSRYTRYLTMLDAFFTVAVRALVEHYRAILAADMCFGPFPLPASVTKSVEEARAKRLPLASFMQEATVVTTHPLNYVTLDQLFKNYMTFLQNANEQRIMRETTTAKFRELLAMALDIVCINGPGGLVVEGRRLARSITEVVAPPGSYRYTGFVDPLPVESRQS